MNTTTMERSDTLWLEREGKITIKAMWKGSAPDMTSIAIRARFDFLILGINGTYTVLSPDNHLTIDDMAEERMVVSGVDTIIMTLEYPIRYLELHDIEISEWPLNPMPVHVYSVEERIDALITDTVAIINDGGQAKVTHHTETKFSLQAHVDLDAWRERKER